MVKLFPIVFFHSFLTSESFFISLFFFFIPSILPTSSALDPLSPSSSAASFPSSNTFLKEVLNSVAEKEQWGPDSNPRVSAVETESARVCAIQSFDFHVRFGGERTLLLKFSEETEAWRKPEKGEVEFWPDLFPFDVGFRQEIKALKLEGPLELSVNGGSEELSVHLPSRNLIQRGLRRVLVGKGIAVEIHGPDEVSLSYPLDVGLLRKAWAQLWPLGLSSCPSLALARVFGPASLVAFSVINEEAYIETSFPSRNTFEMRLAKCYVYEQAQPAGPSHNITSRFAFMEELLAGVSSGGSLLGRPSQLLKTKITSSKLLRFRAEVERNITENDRSWKEAAGWRTRPAVERLWYEIVAKSGGGGGGGGGVLRPVIIRRLSRPLMIVESAAWSHLMSNFSFSESSFIIVPPEALTLDI